MQVPLYPLLSVENAQCISRAEITPFRHYVDNMGAIGFSNNRTTGERTKHEYIRTALVQEYQEEGKILIKFIKSEENNADTNTKNIKHHLQVTLRKISLGNKIKLQERIHKHMRKYTSLCLNYDR